MFVTYFTTIFLALLCLSAGFKDNCSLPSLSSDARAIPRHNFQIGSNPKLQLKQQCRVFSECMDKFSSELDLPRDSSVAIFIRTFIQTVCGSELLREVFDLSQMTALEYSQFEYEYSRKVFETYDVNQASSLAELSTRDIAQNFDVITMPLMVRIKAKAMANFLIFEGVLNTKNAESLALSFAEIVENNARMNMTSEPFSKFRVLGESVLKFILSVDDNAVGPVIAYIFGNEWRLAAENHKIVNK